MSTILLTPKEVAECLHISESQEELLKENHEMKDTLLTEIEKLETV